MAKIQRPHQPRRPNHQVKASPEKAGPAQSKTEPPAPKVPGTKDHFLRGVAEAVYQNHPLVMLCTQPQIRAVAAKLPVIKDVADAICPMVPGAKQALKTVR